MIGATEAKAQTDERMILKIKIVAPRSVKHDSNCSCCCSIAVALRNSIVCNRDVAETTEVPQLRNFIFKSLAKRKVKESLGTEIKSGDFQCFGERRL